MKTAGPLRQRRKFGVAVKRPASLDHPVNVLRCDIPAPCLRYGPPQRLLGTVNKAKATFSPLRCRNRILSSRRQKSMAAEKGGEMRTSLPRTDGQFDFLGLRLRSPQQDREIERLLPAPQSPPITGLPPIAPPMIVSTEAPLTWTTVPSPTLPRPRNAPSVWKRFVIVSAMSALVVGYLTYRSSHGEREMAVPSPFLAAEDVPQPTGLSSFTLEGSAEPEVQTSRAPGSNQSPLRWQLTQNPRRELSPRKTARRWTRRARYRRRTRRDQLPRCPIRHAEDKSENRRTTCYGQSGFHLLRFGFGGQTGTPADVARVYFAGTWS
jgi:hypothetical protein